MRRDWASLPAIQRAVGDTELTASTRDFVASLAGEHEPDLTLAPLGHNVSLEAPPGLVAGIAVPVRTYAPTAELVGRPPRRAAPMAAQRRTITDTVDEPAVPEPSLVPEIDGPPATSIEPELPVAVRPVVAIEAAPVAQAPLTQLSTAARAQLTFARPVQREVQPSSTAESVRLESVVAESAPPIDRPTGPQRLTLGQSRRLGLGAPIPSHPAPAVQRSPAEPTLDLPLAPRPTATAPVEAHAAPSANAPESASEPVSGALAPAAAIQRATEDVVARPVDAPESAPVAIAAQRVIAHSLPPLFLRPAPRPTVPIVSSETRALTTHVVSGASPELSAPPAVQREAVAEIPFAARPFTSHVAEPRLLTPATGASPWSEPATRGDSNETTVDVVPAAVWSAPSVSDTARTADMPAMPLATVQRVATTAVAMPMPSPPWPRRTAAAGQLDPLTLAPLQTVQPLSVQREAPAGEGAISPATPSASEAPAIAPAATAVAAPSAAGPSAGSGPGHEPEKDLDELARKLQDRISAQIRYELLVERERAGMVTDLR